MWEAASQQASWICALSPVGHTCGSCTPLCPCPFVLPSPRGLSPPCALSRGAPVLEKGRERLNSLLLSVPCPPAQLPDLSPPPAPPSLPRESSSGWFWKKHRGRETLPRAQLGGVDTSLAVTPRQMPPLGGLKGTNKPQTNHLLSCPHQQGAGWVMLP